MQPSKALQRMAGRAVKRAGIEGEEGVTVSFGFHSFGAAMACSLLEAIPYVSDLATIAFFSLHRIALVTDTHVYVFRSRPFHRPGRQLGMYELGPGTVERVRGKLTFPDGTVVYHSPIYQKRAKLVEACANQPALTAA